MALFSMRVSVRTTCTSSGEADRLCVRLVRLVEAVRTGFQQPSGPGAEVGTAQARHTAEACVAQAVALEVAIFSNGGGGGGLSGAESAPCRSSTLPTLPRDT